MLVGWFKTKYKELNDLFDKLPNKYQNKLSDDFSMIKKDYQFLINKNNEYRMNSNEFE